jgi:D-amino peptidase
MNVFVMVDMEGISGICRRSQVASTEPHYQVARKLLTMDVNACVDGCVAGGAKKIVVRDAHGSGFNFIWEDLDPRAEYIQGSSGRQRMPEIEKFDGLILLGYHAMAGTPEAVLEHTMSSAGWQNFHMNGVKSGELAIDAGIAGDHGVRMLLVSGDDKVCKEAKKFFKDVVTVQVKQGFDVEGGQLLPLEVAHDRIRKGCEQACREYKRFKPYKVKKPVTMRLELVSRGKVPAHRPDVKVIDGRTYEVKARTVEQALRML